MPDIDTPVLCIRRLLDLSEAVALFYHQFNEEARSDAGIDDASPYIWGTDEIKKSVLEYRDKCQPSQDTVKMTREFIKNLDGIKDDDDLGNLDEFTLADRVLDIDKYTREFTRLAFHDLGAKIDRPFFPEARPKWHEEPGEVQEKCFKALENMNAIPGLIDNDRQDPYYDANLTEGGHLKENVDVFFIKLVDAVDTYKKCTDRELPALLGLAGIKDFKDDFLEAIPELKTGQVPATGLNPIQEEAFNEYKDIIGIKFDGTTINNFKGLRAALIGTILADKNLLTKKIARRLLKSLETGESEEIFRDSLGNPDFPLFRDHVLDTIENDVFSPDADIAAYAAKTAEEVNGFLDSMDAGWSSVQKHLTTYFGGESNG